MQKSICELFAGVGGFRVGMERLASGWKTVWFSQWDPDRKAQWAHECYTRHFGDSVDINGEYHTCEDIAKVDKHSIPDHTLLVGGFPCQDYSVAHTLPTANGIKGTKGSLWWQVNDILSAKQPAFCMLENVDRIIISPKGQRGRDFAVILACFAEQGYSVEWRVVNAALYGGPQRRKRTFIFAYRNDTTYATQKASETAETIIKETGLMAKAFPVSSIGSLKEVKLDGTLKDISENFIFDFENAGYMSNRYVFTSKVVEIEEQPVLLGDVLQGDVDAKHYIPNSMMDRWKYLKGAKKIPRVSKTGYEYFFTEGAIAFPDPLDRPSRTLVTGEGRTDRSSHVVTDPVTGQLRTLTAVETERLQCFDDDWTLGMPDNMRRFCMGNALVTQMVTRMGAVLDSIIANEP